MCPPRLFEHSMSRRGIETTSLWWSFYSHSMRIRCSKTSRVVGGKEYAVFVVYHSSCITCARVATIQANVPRNYFNIERLVGVIVAEYGLALSCWKISVAEHSGKQGMMFDFFHILLISKGSVNENHIRLAGPRNATPISKLQPSYRSCSMKETALKCLFGWQRPSSIVEVYAKSTFGHWRVFSFNHPTVHVFTPIVSRPSMLWY